MIPSLLLLHATAFGCDDLEPVPDTFQVAWISPVDQQIAQNGLMEVVRVRDLRTWSLEHSDDSVEDKTNALLHSLGILERDETPEEAYKVTLFDVQPEWLCRPMREIPADNIVEGVGACTRRQAKSISGHKAGYTGCGYSMDTTASTRGLDVFRIPWATASSQGFCVLPLDRFIEGA